MQPIKLPPIEKRLQKRYKKLVESHMQAMPELAAGIKHLPSLKSSFANTQAAWRFLNNDRIKFANLIEPLREEGCEEGNKSHKQFVLLIHDWCKISYAKDSKKDLTVISHKHDIGYELFTTLLVEAGHGQPLAPMHMQLKTADGSWNTDDKKTTSNMHLEQITPLMKTSQNWGIKKDIIHVIDREADAVDYYRLWNRAGYRFLVRGNERRVQYEGGSYLLSEIRHRFHKEQRFSSIGKCDYHGRPSHLFVAQANITLERPAEKKINGRRFKQPGCQLNLRLLIVEVRGNNAQVLSHWFLLSNVEEALASSAELAQCYYWRWRIESYFKLIKTHGQQIEYWQQKTGQAILRRLLVAAMACVMVWKLQADQSEEAQEIKVLLVKLSGRQMKRNRTETAPALLSGLWILLSMLSLLEHYDINRLKRLSTYLPFFNHGSEEDV